MSSYAISLIIVTGPARGGNIKIGILGGIGPEATGEFYLKLINALQKSGRIRDNSYFPNIIINSIPAPELILEDVPDEALTPYINGLKELDRMHVGCIAMVCNSIHTFYDRLQSQVSAPIIDLRKEVGSLISASKLKRIAVLGTPPTIRCGLYRFAGVETLEPTKEELKVLSKAVFNFNLNRDKGGQTRELRKICHKYLKMDAEKVVLGCTEMALMLQNDDIPYINPLDVLVGATAKRYLIAMRISPVSPL
jgi:aspartate racemase